MASAAYPATAPDQAKGPTGPPAKHLTETQTQAWWRRIQAALDGTKDRLEQGKKNVRRYNAHYLDEAPKEDTVLVPTDFYYVEQKKAQLFYRLPDVFLKPEQPGLEDSGIVFQAALNKKLGPAGVNVLPRVQEVLFDVLCPVGFGALKIGYEPIQDGTIDLPLGPPSVDPRTGAVVPPQMMKVPNLIASRYFIERIPPGDLLVPPDFTGSDFDDAPWIGHRFREDLPDDDAEGSDADVDDRRLVELPAAAKSARRKQRIGYEIFYKARLFDKDQKHPDVIRTFTVYDDTRDQPVDVKMSPYQRFTQQNRLEGQLGYCIAPLTLRYVSDTWCPPSDCTMARAQADELSKGRTQMIQFRNRSMPQVGYDATRVDESTRNKIERNEMASWVGFTGPGQDATWPIEKGRFGRESFTFNDYVQNDLDRIWGLGANQQGVLSDTTRTATELQLTQAASQTRLESERQRVLDWYVNKVVAKFAALLQLFADEQEYVELVGQDAQRLKAIPPEIQQQAAQNPQAQVLIPWTKKEIWGRYTFTVKPDSQLHLDLVQYREQLLKAFNFLANEPTVNRQALTQEVLKAFHFDPAKFTQPPPQKQAEPPKPSLSFTGQDFSPLSPQSPICLDMAVKLGVPLDPNAIQQAMQLAGILQIMQAQQQAAEAMNEAGPETAHGGAAAEAAKINKHPTEATGGMQGSGASAPIAPGGFLQ